MAKTYLVMIGVARRAWAHVGYYPDTPNRNLRIYYCGSDTGDRFEYLGNAAKALESLREAWISNGIPADQIKCLYQTRDEFYADMGVTA